MFCQKCGAQLSDHATTCTSCGAPVSAVGPGAAAAGAAADRMREASKSALASFLSFVGNPVGGIAPACESLQPGRTTGVGIVFGVVFAICFALGAKLGVMSNPFFGLVIGTSNPVWLVIAGLGPFVGLAVAMFLARIVSRGKGGVGEDLFLAGAALLPLGFVSVISWLLGGGNLDVIYAIWVFAICLTVLMLFAGMTRAYGVSERLASVLVPAALLVTGWLAQVIMDALPT